MAARSLLPKGNPNESMTMRTILILLIIFISTLTNVRAEPESLLSLTTRHGISQLEVGSHWNGRPGKLGELSEYQFQEGTWKKYDPNFSDAYNPRIADEVARKHIAMIADKLIKAGKPVTPENIGRCWNGGFAWLHGGHLSSAAKDYGNRLSNLATEEMQKWTRKISMEGPAIKASHIPLQDITVNYKIFWAKEIRKNLYFSSSPTVPTEKNTT